MSVRRAVPALGALVGAVLLVAISTTHHARAEPRELADGFPAGGPRAVEGLPVAF